jgi:hypothetical protein
VLQYEYNTFKQIEENNLKETEYFHIIVSPCTHLEDHFGAVEDHPKAVEADPEAMKDRPGRDELSGGYLGGGGNAWIRIG